MRDGNHMPDTIVDSIIYIGINATLVCGIITFFSCGFAIITIICNLLAELVVTVSQRLTAWSKKRKTYFSKSEPKNVVVLSPDNREVPRENTKSSFNRTPLNLESVCFDSSSNMEYFSLDEDGFEEHDVHDVLPCECRSTDFYSGVKCHSTPNGNIFYRLNYILYFINL